MKVNWKVRIRNKVWLMSMASLIIAFVYGVLEACDVIPAFSETRAVQAVQALLTFLGLIGVVQDPTTQGLSDSNRALTYEQPWIDGVDYDGPYHTGQVEQDVDQGENG